MTASVDRTEPAVDIYTPQGIAAKSVHLKFFISKIDVGIKYKIAVAVFIRLGRIALRACKIRRFDFDKFRLVAYNHRSYNDGHSAIDQTVREDKIMLACGQITGIKGKYVGAKASGNSLAV